MPHKHFLSLPALTGESVMTDAAPAQPQPTTAQDGAPTGNAPAGAGAEVTTTKSQSIAAAETPVATPAPVDGTFANAKVPNNSQALAVQPPIVPLTASEVFTLLCTKPSVAEMTLDEKFTCLKQGFAYGYGVRRVLVEVFESIRDEVKTYAKDRAGMPTVEEAFKQRGLNYHTVYSAIQREKDRRAEDAKFFAAIKTEQSTKNIHGVDITDNDLPPVNTEVVVDGGRQAIVVTHGVTDGGKTAKVIYKDDSTSAIVKAGDLVTRADVLAKKAAAKAARDAAKAAEENDEDGKGKKEEAETARIAAAAAKKDAALKSSDFYAAQYFALVALINGAPKEMTPAEFAQTVTENLRVAADAMNAEEAKRLKPLPPAFPSFNGTKGMNNLITVLSAVAVGRPSPLKTIFGGLDKDKFREKVGTFAQRICDLFYEGEFVVAVGNRKSAETKAAAPAPKPNQPLTAKVGTETDGTAHGFYAKLTKETEFGTPWHVFQIGGSKKPLAFVKTRQDAEFETAKLERKFVADTEKAKSAEAV